MNDAPLHVDAKPAAVHRDDLVFWPLFALGILLLYGLQGNAQEVSHYGPSALGWMIQRWDGSGGDLTHGWLIPLVSLGALWTRRKTLATCPKSRYAPGLLLILLALMLHGVGFRTQLTRLSLFSLILLLWSVPLFLYGRTLARLIRFPCAYLIFCIPLSFLDSITVPLRLLASRIAAFLLNGIGIPAVSRGTAIFSEAAGQFNFDVADACSGLRSLLAMTAITAVFAWLTQKGLLRQSLLFLSALPLAMAGNIARIVVIAMIAVGFGQERAIIVYEQFSGMLVFVVAVGLMVGFATLLNRIGTRGATPP